MRNLSLMIFLSFALIACDAKDDCLDAGGSWQEESKTCLK